MARPFPTKDSGSTDVDWYSLYTKVYQLIEPARIKSEHDGHSQHTEAVRPSDQAFTNKILHLPDAPKWIVLIPIAVKRLSGF